MSTTNYLIHSMMLLNHYLIRKNKYASLLEKIGNARFVLIGEATHGTQEFYQARAEITQELIEKKGFMALR